VYDIPWHTLLLAHQQGGLRPEPVASSHTMEPTK
jgi:hypothetical protein